LRFWWAVIRAVGHTTVATVMALGNTALELATAFFEFTRLTKILDTMLPSRLGTREHIIFERRQMKI